ncbi:MAG: Fe-S cluster assembly protein SufD [Timaviella obliquedivisa GSE-PSE-MK23-08B]|jgi:Fe-S cluster assembly protein SufD|nr:Fe-S cluster assembly protein SufD [Timaviella obliquedivisa GSE-PSE-MK23-08B]
MSIQASVIPDLEIASTASEKRSACLSNLLKLRSPFLTVASPWLQSIRESAATQVQALAIPSTRDEEWRFTDLSALMSSQFLSSTSNPLSVDLNEIKSLLIPEATHRLVFVNGVYNSGLSQVNDLPSGLFVGSLSEALKVEAVYTALQAHFGQQPGSEDVFTLLNTASFSDTAVLWVEKNQEIAAPVQLLFLSLDGAELTISHPRCLIVAEKSSSLTVVEDYASLGLKSNLCNAVTEVWVDENAQVEHTRIQRECHAAYHIGKTVVSQARSSRYTCNAVSTGAKLSRHNLEIYQTGEQTETTLNGLTMIAGEQVGDMHSAIALTAPHGTTHQLHKCIVNDRAHAIFNGKVFVPKAAQMTNAGQLNRNLLLSPKARVDTKPQLEIVADNVKCTHGATVSQLEDDEVFYLQSRGIDAESAQKLLVYAFAFEIISKIPIASLQEDLAQWARRPLRYLRSSTPLEQT